MKKFLSIILATAILISLVPAAFASDTAELSHVEKYDFASTADTPLALTHRGENADYVDYIIGDVTYSLLKEYHIDYTAQNWKWLATNNETIMKASKSSLVFRMVKDSFLQLSLSSSASGYVGVDPTLALALAFKAPSDKAAFYYPTLYVKSSGYRYSAYNFFLRAFNGSENRVDSIGYYTDSKYKSGYDHDNNTTPYKINKALYTSSGDEFVLGITGPTNDHRFDYLTLTEILNPTIKIKETSYSLVVGENDTASISTTVTGKTVIDSVETNVSLDVAKEFLTYKTGNASVATVSADGTVTAKGAGKTIVWAESTDGVYASAPVAVTVEDPTKPTIKYDILSRGTPDGVELSSFTDYSRTDGFWKYYGKGNGGQEKYMKVYLDGGSNGWNDRLELIGCGGNTEGNYVALKINVPEKGKYTVTQYYGAGSNGTENAVMHILPGNTAKSDVIAASNDSNKVLTLNCYATSSQAAASSSRTVSGTYEFEAGEYLLVYRNLGTVADSNIFIGNIILAAGSGDALMPSFSGNTTLEVGATATLKGFLSSTATAATVTYNSSNDCVTVSADGTITAAKAGKATVTMTASDSTVVAANPYTVEITVPNAKTGFASVAIDDDGDGNVTITSAKLGEDVTATAKVPEGKIFRGWVRGSADNGRLVSTESTYTFKAMTNIYLTAVYSDAPTVATNEYYNWNGQFLGNTKPDSVPSLVGYTFAKTWTKAKVEDLITSYIADFTKNDADYEVTANGFTVTKADNKYDTEVTCTADNAVYWYRDGKLVDYGTEYKFFIWDNTTITTSNEGHNGAKLMLDKAKGKSYMVEYDAGNSTLLEVGILFGATGEVPTVERCHEKMSSQREDFTHGQFTATSDYEVARGYLIYKDGDSYRVIYAD